jgi:hypothetical protein
MAARRCLHTAFLLLVAASPSAAQEGQASGDFPVRDLPSEILACLSPVLFPKIFQDAWCLKEYLRSDAFAEVRSRAGDRLSVDAIYARARTLCWDNTFEALLISCIATMDHDRFGVRLPLLGTPLWFTLTSEDEDAYRERWMALPSRIYADTPPGRQGDRDKLQHFFGSALVAFVSESREQAEEVGEFVEIEEEAFVIGGRADARDVRANSQGQDFGLRLLQDRGARPSGFMTYAVAAMQADSTSAAARPDAADSSDYSREHR